jgi:hypothetical protein
MKVKNTATPSNTRKMYSILATARLHEFEAGAAISPFGTSAYPLQGKAAH